MWEPAMGKWHDDENYDIKDPLWRELLELASHHGSTKRLRQVLTWFYKKNMHGDYYKILLIGCVLKKAGVRLDEYIGASYLALIDEMTGVGDTIDKYAVHLLKKEHAEEEVVEEFTAQFAQMRCD